MHPSRTAPADAARLLPADQAVGSADRRSARWRPDRRDRTEKSGPDHRSATTSTTVPKSHRYAHDFWTAYREGALRGHAAPVHRLADAGRGRAWLAPSGAGRIAAFPGAAGICRRFLPAALRAAVRRLVREQLYTAAAVIASPRKAPPRMGGGTELSPATGLRTFVSALAGHMAAVAAQLGFGRSGPFGPCIQPAGRRHPSEPPERMRTGPAVRPLLLHARCRFGGWQQNRLHAHRTGFQRSVT